MKKMMVPGLRRSPGEGNGDPLQYSCLENPMDRGAWQAAVHAVTNVVHDLVTTPPPTMERKVNSIFCNNIWEKNLKKSSMCICITESLWCTLETHTTL